MYLSELILNNEKYLKEIFHAIVYLHLSIHINFLSVYKFDLRIRNSYEVEDVYRYPHANLCGEMHCLYPIGVSVNCLIKANANITLLVIIFIIRLNVS